MKQFQTFLLPRLERWWGGETAAARETAPVIAANVRTQPTVASRLAAAACFTRPPFVP